MTNIFEYIWIWLKNLLKLPHDREPNCFHSWELVGTDGIIEKFRCTKCGEYGQRLILTY